jgi:DNA (cytosine-5)-methyltransferase 1
VTLTVGSLFSGIGGLDLGLERAGMTVAWQAEVDPYACRVLAKHWPDVPNLGDVASIDWSSTERVDLIAGGFPCQDVSKASRTRLGVDGGDKSGLWRHMAAAVRHLRPRYVLVENVAALLSAGWDRVLGDLAAFGYDAEWQCLPAAAFGAPHLRDRVYLVAYPSGERHRTPADTVFAGWTGSQLHGGWAPEPAVGRVVDGATARLDRTREPRLKAIGNAVCPPVAEWIGRRILDAA